MEGHLASIEIYVGSSPIGTTKKIGLVGDYTRGCDPFIPSSTLGKPATYPHSSVEERWLSIPDAAGAHPAGDTNESQACYRLLRAL